MNIITDADLSLLFAPIADKDVKLTFVADCCHRYVNHFVLSDAAKTCKSMCLCKQA